MRKALEVQRAHDMLIEIAEGRVPGGRLPADTARQFGSILCWVLEHDHDKFFGCFLERLEEAAAAAGFKLQPGTPPGEPWVRDDEVLRDLIELAGFSIDVTLATIATWTDPQCQQVEAWAAAVHVAASDNDDVQVPPMPEFLKPLITR